MKKILKIIDYRILIFVFLFTGILIFTTNKFSSTKNECLIVFNSNSDFNIPNKKIDCNSNLKNLISPQKENYIFLGWYDENNNKIENDIQITKNTTLTAKWEKETNEKQYIYIKNVKLNYNNKTLNKSDSINLKVNIEPNNATNKDFYWSSSNPKVATVDQNGKVTALQKGNTIITVTSKDGGYKDKCNIKVTSHIKEIKFKEKNIYMNNDSTKKLNLIITPNDADNKDFYWSSSNSKIATVDQNGKVTAISNGTTTITVKTKDNKFKTSIKIIVNKLVTNITLNKTNISLKKNNTFNLTYTIKPNDAGNKDIIWSSSNSKIATVDQNGKVTAISSGNSIITASSKDGNTKATCKVNVYVPLNGIKTNVTNLQLGKNEIKKVNVIFTPSDATNKTIIWSSSNQKIATVDQNGNIKGISNGSTTIIVKSEDNKFKTSINVTVKNLVTNIKLNKTSLTLNKNKSFNLTYDIYPEYASNKSVTWSSSNPKIATVDQNGKVTAVSGGITYIYISSKDGNFKTSCRVIVNVPVTGIQIDKKKINLNKGQNSKITATIKPSDATNKTIIWSSSNPKVATVDQNGNIKAISDGITNITAATKENNYKIISTITVKTPVTGIKLNTSNITINKTNTKKIIATIKPNDATNKTIIWSSNDPEIVSVDAKGIITAKKIGTATITAKTKDGNFKAKTKVSVKVAGNYINPTTTKKVYKSKLTLSNKARNMQSWIKDDNYLYITQRDAYINKIDANNNSIVSCINLPKFGHLGNIDFEKTNNNTFIWVGCDGIEKKDAPGEYKSTKICRIKLTNNLFSPNGNNCKTITKDQLNVKTYNYQGQAAIDNNNRILVIRHDTTYKVYNLDDFINSSSPKIAFKFSLPDNTNNISWQGFTVNGNYIYILEGNPTTNNNYSIGPFLSIYSLQGEKIAYRYKLGNPTNKEIWEPEGIKIINNKIFLGFSKKVENTTARHYIYKLEK